MKLTIEQIIGYAPYGLKAMYTLGSNSKVLELDIVDFKLMFDESCIYKIKPILTRVEDMSANQKIKMYFINDSWKYNLPTLASELSKFFYSNHIDIHSLIDCGLAIDKKTLKA